jgi:hypothetical protein
MFRLSRLLATSNAARLVLAVRRRAQVLFGVLIFALIPIGATCAEIRSYFPATEFHDLETYNADEPKAWSDYLSLFGEPILFDDDSSEFAIRLTLAPAFSNGAVIRIFQNKAGLIQGVTKRFLRTSQTVVASNFDVSQSDLKIIKLAISRERFWALGNKQRVITTDGVPMLLEIKCGSRYHVVYVSDALEGPVLRIAQLLATTGHVHLPGR